MARVLKESQFYLHTLRSSANRMNHTCLCLPSRSWYSFTDPGSIEGPSWPWMAGYMPKLEIHSGTRGIWSIAKSTMSELFLFL